MRETPSGYPKPNDEITEDDSDAPTQLWESPFKYLSEFPVRRAARRRERIEALLKGQDITATNLLSSTNLTRTSTSNTPGASGATQRMAQPQPSFEEDEPQSIPTGTYTSVKPVNGPRLAVFIAVGVAVGGLAALQLNRFLTPAGSVAQGAFAAMAPGSDGVIPAAEPPRQTPVPDSTKEVLVHAPTPPAEVPPLHVDVVPLRPVTQLKSSKPGGASEPSLSAGEPGVSPQSPPQANLSSDLPADVACSRFPSIQIPTQLHPRMNPLMTSSQVFTERASQTSPRAR